MKSYRIVGMFLIALLYLQGTTPPPANNVTYATDSDGDWTSTSPWDANGIPPTNSNIGNGCTINIGHNLTYTAGGSYPDPINWGNATSLTINVTAGSTTLEGMTFGSSANNFVLHVFNGATLIINGNFDVKNQFSIDVDDSGILIINGNVSINNNATGDIDGAVTISGNLSVGNGTSNAIGGDGVISVGGTISDNSGVVNSTLIYKRMYSKQTGTWSDKSNWSYNQAGSQVADAAPTFRSRVTIQANHTMTVGSNTSVDSLKVETNGKVVVSSGISLTVTTGASNSGTIEINTSGNGGLLSNTTSLNGIVKPTYVGKKYHYVSSPVTNVNASVYNTGNPNFYYYNEAASNTNIMAGWTSAAGSLSQGKGYAFYIDQDATYTLGSGTLNTGTINITVTKTGTAATNSTYTWNLIGNPYPCNVDANAFINANKSSGGTINQSITGTLYFWSDDATQGGGYSTTDYATYTTGGGVAANGSTPTQYIGIGQGFFVQTSGANGSKTITFNDAMKNAGTSTFFKSGNDVNSSMQKITLRVTTSANHVNALLVKFVDDASDDVDIYDGEKKSGSSQISFYTIKNSSFYAIEGRPTIAEGETATFDLGIKAGHTGTYTIESNSIENLNNFYRIYLVDNQIADTTDLQQNAYSFAVATTGNIHNRFQLLVSRSVQHVTQWVGTTNDDVNDVTKWSNGLPESLSKIIVPQGTQMSINNAITCNDLIIEPGAALTLTNSKANVNIASPMIIQSDANGTGSFIDMGNNNIQAQVQRYLPIAGRYYYIGSPIWYGNASAMGTSEQLTGTGLTSERKLYEYDAINVTWNKVNSNLVAMQPGQGFAFKTPADNTGVYTFEGLLTTGEVNFSLVQGFNLIANPYPSGLDWGNSDVQTGWTSESLSPSIWYRVGGSGGSGGGGNFAVYNRALDFGLNGAQRVIPSMQAFWVYADNDDVVTVNNNARTAENPDFYKKNTTSLPKGIKITLFDDNNTDETAVCKTPLANKGIDQFDTRKMQADNKSQLFVIDQQQKLAIHSLSDWAETEKIQLGFSTPKNGSYKINAHWLDMVENTLVLLEDKKTGTLTDIAQNDYIFDAQQGEDNHRFIVHLIQTATNTNTDITENKQVFVVGNMLYLSNVEKNTTVLLYNATGQCLINQKISEPNMQLNVPVGVYYVQMVSQKETISTKLFVY